MSNAHPDSPTQAGAFGSSLRPNVNRPCTVARCLLVISLTLILQAAAGCKPRNRPTTTPAMDSDPIHWIRVLLLNNAADCEIEIAAGFAVMPADSDITPARFDKQTDPMKVTVAAGKMLIGDLPVRAYELDILPDPPHVINLNGHSYRGQLRLIANPDNDTFNAINLVPLEPYLAGVVGAEMPEYWEPTALQAQAIAARTYCLYTKNRFGVNRSWDVSRTQASQVYVGLDGESERIWDAVNKTAGQILACKDDGDAEIFFPAYYSSTCGGHTEDCENVFGESFPALKGVPCQYCKNVARPRFFFWPIVKIDKTQVSEILTKRYASLEKLGEITAITPIHSSDHEDFSRITRVQLTGGNGDSDWLRGEDFRLAIDSSGRKLRSAAFEIIDAGDQWEFRAGRGYGHGVGLCQCGAQQMARQGLSAHDILLHYYSNAQIVNLYEP